MISTVDHWRMPLLDQLVRQARSPHQRFYMPGHKGVRGSASALINLLGASTLQADIPELPDLDQLFAPIGVIRDAQMLAAHAFGAEQTHFLINGTSVGLMAAVMAVCGPGDAIIVPRSCHQSIVHGLILSGARPIWVSPEFDRRAAIPHCLTPSTLETAIQMYPRAKAAIAISPTYEGICGDGKGLATIAHDAGIPLIVDEAHGAHLCFHPDLPPSALSQDADLVVQSTHKILGALSQASMLHVQGDRIDRDKLQTTLTLLQSSSPNYLLLASLDAARQQMATQGTQILDDAMRLSDHLRQTLQPSRSFHLLEPDGVTQGFVAIDPLKLTLCLEKFALSGFELDDCLAQDYQIFAELPTEYSLTFMLGQGNSAQDLEQLSDAIAQIEHRPPPGSNRLPTIDAALIEADPSPKLSPLTPREAFYHRSKPMDFERSIGEISAKLICPYPPGIPILFPGEEITSEAIAMLIRVQNLGGQIIGLPDPKQNILGIVEC